jgi:hypothetical protein
MAKMKFSATLAAVKEHWQSRWDLCDALLEESDGSRASLKAIAAQVPHYDVATLRRMRQTAERFPVAERVHGLSWELHHAAGSHVVILATIMWARQRRRHVTAALAREVRRAHERR